MNATVYLQDERDYSMTDCHRLYVSSDPWQDGYIRSITFERREGSPFVPPVFTFRAYGAIEIVCAD